MSDCTPPCRIFHYDDSKHSLSTTSTSSSERLFYETNMPENSKRRVDLATAGEGLSGKRCLIENTDEANVVLYVHCLSRVTKDHILDALEFSWGMDRQTLNVDTRQNVFRLGSKFHALYYKKSPMWLLLPEEHIIQQYYNARNDRNKFPDIDKSVYRYNFLSHDDMVSVPIHRLTQPDNLSAAPPAAAYTYFAHPYPTLSPVVSHVHPKFVICNAGRKMQEDATGFLAFSRLYPNHARALEMVAAIWKAWTTIADTQSFRTFRKQPYVDDNMSNTSQRTAKRRVFAPSNKRGRNLDESPLASGSKRSKAGQGQNDCIWLDDETLREHDRKDLPKAQWKNKKAWISDWTKVVGKTGIAVEQALDLDVVTDEAQTAQ